MERKRLASGTIFRSAGWNAFVFCCALVFVVIGVGTAVYGGGVDKVMYGGLAAASLIFAVRSLRAGAVVDERGITVRNFLRTVRVPWADVVAVSAGTSGKAIGGRCIILTLTNGRTIRVNGVSGYSDAVDCAADEIATLRPAAP